MPRVSVDEIVPRRDGSRRAAMRRDGSPCTSSASMNAIHGAALRVRREIAGRRCAPLQIRRTACDRRPVAVLAPKRLAAKTSACGDGSGPLSLTISSVADVADRMRAWQAKNGSSRAPRIRCAAIAGQLIGEHFMRTGGVSVAARRPRIMPPLRLAVDARVIAEDTRGIGRYRASDSTPARSRATISS